MGKEKNLGGEGQKRNLSGYCRVVGRAMHKTFTCFSQAAMITE